MKTSLHFFAAAHPGRAWRGIAVPVCCFLLSGCFDLAQNLTLDRSGAGVYDTAIAASGLLGEALRDNKADIHLARNPAKTRLLVKDGKVTRIASVGFKSLSDLRLSSDSLSLVDHGATWLGLGPSHLTLRRTLLVDRARRENMRGRQDDRFGSELLQTMFGDHTYVFSVTVPGSIERAKPVRIGAVAISPKITGSGLSHTASWRLPLYTLLQAKLVRFEVDFSAYGSFHDAQSLPE